MKIIASLAALVVLSACSDWSFEEPTPQQIAIASYICGDEADRPAVTAYLEARGQSIAALPDFGPEREAYCAARGDRLAAMMELPG